MSNASDFHGNSHRNLMKNIERSSISLKFRAFLFHLTVSLVLAGLAAWLVFGLWYPYPYREISGGRELFFLIVSVDVIMGPLITFVVFNPAKSRREKILDFGVIGLLQTGALLYGLWSVAQARPVHMVFEYNRFHVVHAVDILPELLVKASPELQRLPLAQPTYLSLRPMTATEEMEMTLAAVGGVPLAARPELWQSYDAAHAEILKESKPATELRARFVTQANVIDHAVSHTDFPIERLRYLPLLSRTIAWTVLIDGDSAKPVGFIPIDPF